MHLTGVQVYSPYKKQWLKVVNDKLDHYLKEVARPTANDPSVRKSKIFAPLFEAEVPASIPGFELDDAEKEKMAEVWPAGESAAREVSGSAFLVFSLLIIRRSRFSFGFCIPRREPRSLVLSIPSRMVLRTRRNTIASLSMEGIGTEPTRIQPVV